MRDVLCVGIGCLDVLVRGADMALPFQGEAKKCECVALEIGGDAINQAVALRRLGVDAGLVTGLGTDEAGELILSQLNRRGVPTEGIVLSPGHSRINVILIQGDGQRHFLHEAAPAPGSLFAPPLPDAGTAKIISIGSLLAPPFLTPESIDRFTAAAAESGAILCADVMCNGRLYPLDELKAGLSRLDYFFPNYEEASLLTGQRDLMSITSALLDCGIRHIVVKTGRDGCFVRTQQEHFFVPAVPAQALDTTGAGDNFVAGFLCARLEDRTLFDCCRFAAATAALSISQVGASSRPISREQVDALLKKIS